MNILTFDDFFPDVVTHGFFGRCGGVSTGLYDSLNCSPQSKDVPEHVIENRARVLAVLGGNGLSTLKQIHSPICIPVENSCMQGVEEGDALVTKTAGQVIGCLTADCGPVLFYGADRDNQPVIGAAHAGWGGALKGVLESTIAAMIKLEVVPSTLRAAIGPCIGQASYEVGAEFKVPFITEDAGSHIFFKQGNNDKLFFDMQGYIIFRLKRAGIDHIIAANKDTYALKEDYFSYRRATHEGVNDYGRQISAISIRCT
jgi:YfiH family protein